MNLALKQNSMDPKVSYFSKSKPIAKPRCSTQDKFQNQSQDGEQQSDPEDAFNMTITDRRPEEMRRIIKRSVVNRSCINTLNYNCRDLDSIPPELAEQSIHKLSQVQKIDLSFNNISDIHGILFSKMDSLKELILNDNSISQLPFSEMNLCKGLKFINISSNKLYILPPLTRPSFVEARLNPFRLVTSDLVKLSQIEFITFDWLDYLVEGNAYQGEDRFKESSAIYSKFKTNILEKIDYEHEDNSTYCDFHAYFSVKLSQTTQQQRSNAFLSFLIVKAIHRNDSFFINYLRNYQNQFNYPQLMYSNKLLLEMALENNNESVVELYRLKKANYAFGVPDLIYFESVRLACRYSHYEMFEFLMSIRQQKKKITSKEKIEILIKEVFQKFDREKESHKILHSLVNLSKEINGAVYSIAIPQEFNSKKFRSLSMAILEIQQNKDLQPYFQIGTEDSKGNPLHFAMKSRNQQLLKEFLEGGQDVFDRNLAGVSCKYMYGCTQVSRKMVWKREKKIIRQFWNQRKESEQQIIPSNKRSHQSIENNPSKVFIELDDSFQSYMRSFRQPMSSSRKMIMTKTVGQSQTNCMIQDKILPFLFVRIKEYVTLSWRKDYAKKLNCLNSFIEYLLKLNKHREESMIKRMEIWKKISDKLTIIFEMVPEEDPLLQYEIHMASEGVNGIREDRCLPSIKVEGQKASIQSGGFWCCQNLEDDV